MKTSESIKNLTGALLKAQAQMGAAVKGAKNPFFKSNYADLPTVMEVVKGPLNENGLLILQPTAHRDGKNFIDTVILHGDTGEFISSETEVICAKQNDPQAFGAAQTYARRFGLQAMGFIPSEDDDGNYASGRSAPAKPAYQATAKAAPIATTPVAPVLTSVSAPIQKALEVQQQAVDAGLHKTPAIDPVAEMAADPTPGTVAPLQKSSFRKGAKQPAQPNTAAAQAAAPSESEWG